MTHSDTPTQYDVNANEKRDLDRLRDDKLFRQDYSSFDRRFNNLPVEKGPEFTGLRAQQFEYAQKYAREWQPPRIRIPFVEDLTPALTTRIPTTRHWLRRSSSMEKNGILNIGTIRFFFRLRLWLFYPFVVWGCTNQVISGMHGERFDLSSDDNKIYDKLSVRAMPSFRVWARPG